jgi:hypothetical protein
MRSIAAASVAALAVLPLAGCLGGGVPTAEVGECLQVSELGSQVESLPTVSCDEPHEGEVYAVFDLDMDGDYDANAVIEASEQECLARFDTFVGMPYADSELDIFYLYPLADGWAGGDRETLCAVIAPNWETGDLTMVTGSLEGAAR